MGTREALIIDAGGERLRFYYDRDHPTVLHVTLRHGTTPEDAIRAFFEGVARWDDRRMRYETVAAQLGLYWSRHAHDGSVVVISCFPRGEE